MAALLVAGLALLGRPRPAAFPAEVPAWEQFTLPPGDWTTVPPAQPRGAGDPVLEVHVPAAGDGEAVLVRCGGRAVLIGAGGPWAGPRVAAYLDRAGVRRLEAVVIAHDAPYHVGGVPYVLERIPVNAVHDAVRTSAEPAHREALRAVTAAGIAYRQVRGGDRWDLGCGGIRALTPLVEGDGEDVQPGPLADTGAALLVHSPQVRVLLAGSLGAEGEEALTRVYPDLTVDVLVVGRRGHRTATSAVLLERAAPRLAVIPVGPYNEEGRPHADVLERLEAAGVRVYRTDRDGTIQMTAAPRGPRVRLVPPQPPP